MKTPWNKMMPMMELRQLRVSGRTRGTKLALLNHEASKVWLFRWLKVFQTSSVQKEDSRRKPGLKSWLLKVSTQMIQWLQICEMREEWGEAYVIWPLVESSVKYCQVTVLVTCHCGWRLVPCFKEDFISVERAVFLPQNCHFADPLKIRQM